MAQPKIDFSTSPTETTTSPPIAQTTSSNSSAPSSSSAKSRQNTGSPPTNGTNGTSTVAQPNPRSCVTCRKRKVRCDKRHPCSNCNKAAIECIFPGPGRAPRRSRKPPDAELLARLRRLEGVVQHLGKNLDEEVEKTEEVGNDQPMKAEDAAEGDAKSPKEEARIPKSCGLFNGPEPRKKSVNGVVQEFGQLVVEEGRSRYVSNKFWSSMSEEVSAAHLLSRVSYGVRPGFSYGSIEGEWYSYSASLLTAPCRSQRCGIFLTIQLTTSMIIPPQDQAHRLQQTIKALFSASALQFFPFAISTLRQIRS